MRKKRGKKSYFFLGFKGDSRLFLLRQSTITCKFVLEVDLIDQLMLMVPGNEKQSTDILDQSIVGVKFELQST